MKINLNSSVENLKDFVSKHKSKSVIILFCTTLLLVIPLIIAIDNYFYSNTKELINSWLQYEKINLQQGNLLTPVSKIQKSISSKSSIQGIKVLDSENRIMMSYGIHFDVSQRIDLDELSLQSYRYQLFKRIYIVQTKNLKIFILTSSNSYIFISLFLILYIIAVFLISIYSTKNFTMTIANLSHQKEIESIELKIIFEKQFNHLSRQMSHDIRSPLATLNSIADNFEGRNPEDVKLLRLSIDRINQISNSLLEQGKATVIKKFELNKSIKDIIELKKYEFKKCDVFLKDISNRNFIINGNQIEFERMLSNLINNAIESNDNPKVSIEIFEENNQIKLQIKDNGPGIPQSIIDNLGKEIITTKDKGNGLGLNHAINTVKDLNANLNFESSENGTIITITFSRFESVLNEQKIVLIDDDQLVQLTWKSKAQKNNISLEIFSNEHDFLEKLNTFSKTTTFYIDSELGLTKGEDLATKLYDQGFTNIYIASGHEESKFSHLIFLKGVIGKKPPF